MTISRKLAHKLQNMIQTVMSYIELKQEGRAKKKLQEMSGLIERHADERCDDCEKENGENNPQDSGQ